MSDGLLKDAALQRVRDMLVEAHWTRKREASGNPLLRRGAKYFSQNDEDGILLEVFRRMGLKEGVFVEIGVGNGLENNSLIALFCGWRGLWIDAGELAFAVPNGGPLVFRQAWVTRENCASIVGEGLRALGGQPANLLSIDVDGNDFYVLQALLEAGQRPEVVIAEYNGKFPPPIRWTIPYDAAHRWDLTDYQGASLQLLVDLMRDHGYRLVACNITGANAFFVREAHAGRFADIPAGIEDIYVRPDYNWFVRSGHPPSPLTLSRFLEQAVRR